VQLLGIADDKLNGIDHNSARLSTHALGRWDYVD
jgi:hypothetical protein